MNADERRWKRKTLSAFIGVHLRFLLLATVLSAPAAEVASLEVDHDRVTAADLATLLPAWRNLPGDTTVLLGPMPGATREVWRVELDRLDVRHGLAVTPAQGPERIRIERRLRNLTSTEATAAVAASLAERYRVSPDDVLVELIGFSEPLVPAGPLRFRSTGLLPPAGEAGAIPLSWVTPERRSATLGLRAKVEIRGHYAVAARPLAARQALSAGDIVFEEGPLPRPPERWRVGPADLPGKMLARAVAAGEKIPRSAILLKPVIERGAVVELELKRGPIEMRAPGKAEQAGAIGQRLIFRNLTSGRRVTARVVTDKKAEVIP